MINNKKEVTARLAEEHYNPITDSVICQYCDIDANGAVTLNALCEDKFSNSNFIIKKKAGINNLYIDKNYFEVLIADPISKAHYYLYNIYYIDAGHIYLAGINAKLSFENNPLRPVKCMQATHLILDWHFNVNKNEFIYNLNPLYSLKFNPNYFSQIASFENLEKTTSGYKRYERIVNCVTPYDRPSHYMQRAFFINGANSVLKCGLKYDSYNKIISHYNSSHLKDAAGCYFSFEQFYLSGALAALNFYKIK